ncbi:3'-5' exoribonuclease YhaM [Limihaloglobus sulfuriphilus]|uniref:3'-5' exoribonuclease YhaM n=1 Tax=Limihaloglobus sulfuriphilus TaxID=1851148 RepID=A0A1Q2MCI8_9BACT|nr:HD domain-containing protein [Limihaloglobus sulfuriphilus]AQQ69962.1 3'-5' exoribonuclease YhaM [Limihaloglobus sulfuriphilus]
MERVFIKDLKAGMDLDQIFLVTQPVLRSTSRGDLYIAMFLSDKTGKVNCRVWNATEDLYNQIPKEGFIRVRAKTELYQGSMQIVANGVFPVDQRDVKIMDFLPRTEYNITEMFEELKGFLSKIKHPHIKALIDEFLTDKDLMKQFCIAPAAVKMHHGYLGGLLEHTLSMMRSANALLPLYPNVQADIVIAGIFLHDMAKTEELSYELAFSYTRTGQLLGHIIQGTIMVDQKADMLLDKGIEMDKEILDQIQHILVAHHGKYEFGSPKLPATPEAIFVSYIDDLDAKLNFIDGAIENEAQDDEWTVWKPSNVNPGTRFYRKKIED